MSFNTNSKLARLALLTAVATCLSTPTLWAHAVLVRSTPAAHATIEGPGTPIELTFNSRLDASRCSVSLISPDGGVHPLKLDAGAEPNVLRANARGLVKGDYRVRWQALSTDGHVTRGEVSFRVE